jgi:uncharacterized DUF497 family protein
MASTSPMPATALHDDRALTIRDSGSDEDRFVTLGMDALGRVLVVVFTGSWSWFSRGAAERRD